MDNARKQNMCKPFAGCENAEELIRMAKEQGIELSDQLANRLFEGRDLDEDELEVLSGGSGSCSSSSSAYCPKCGEKMKVFSMRNGMSDSFCSKCGYR